jgi:O-glycosyl hydrolase
MHRLCLAALLAAVVASGSVLAQALDFTAVRAHVDFSKALRPWDGFGVNYVETSQTFDYEKWPQDYGGFRFLKEDDRRRIVDLVFGAGGLQVSLLKMFLDPHHQATSGGPYDHERTTAHMRFVAREGVRTTRARGADLQVITTLYGPPAYMTRQNVIRGRDVDPRHREALADYMVEWARFLREREGLPVRVISLHNEGESWRRWPADGGHDEMVTEGGHDYNVFFPPEQVADLVKLLRRRLDARGLSQVRVTPGEWTNWYRFPAWGYADALADDEEALRALGLITSHGFYVGGQEAGRWFGPHTSRGNDILRARRPDLHAWCTSTSWDVKVGAGAERRYVMNAGFVKELHGNIYEAGVNAIIPWAFIQNASQWNKPDPNPGSAIRTYDDGTWEIKKGYYYYKQVSRAGQPGMAVVRTSAMDSELALIGFASNGTRHPDAVVVINFGPNDWKTKLGVQGTAHTRFHAFRTTGSETYELRATARPLDDGSENFRDLGVFSVEHGAIVFDAPANSVTTFFGVAQ